MCFISCIHDLFFPLSDGGGATTAGCVELDVCPCGGPHSWLVPAMLSPPESLLISCIRRGNFMEARQVSLGNWTQKNLPMCFITLE